MASPARQLSIRIPDQLYQEVREMSRRRGRSINRLVIGGLEALVAQDLATAMRAAYDRLGTDECDVERFLPAQAEVLDGD